MASRRYVTMRTRAITGTPRVGLVGLLGQGNLGNDGSLEAVLGFLAEQQPNAILDFLCTGTEQMTARYGVPATPLRWYNKETSAAGSITALAAKGMKVPLGIIIDAIRIGGWVRRHDVVIVPGMGVLEATLPLRAWHTPYSMFLVSALGKVFRTKVALVSVGAIFASHWSGIWSPPPRGLRITGPTGIVSPGMRCGGWASIRQRMKFILTWYSPSPRLRTSPPYQGWSASG